MLVKSTRGYPFLAYFGRKIKINVTEAKIKIDVTEAKVEINLIHFTNICVLPSYNDS